MAREFGLLAEFETPAAVMHAAQALRDAGLKRFDVHSPFPIHGMDRAMGLGGSKVPWIVLLAGIAGGTGALLLQWWTAAVDYKLVISGKPLFSLPAFIPITFEGVVLLSAFGAVIGMLALNGLPRLYHPLLKVERFARASDDRFFVSVEARDPRYNRAVLLRRLRELGAAQVEVVEE